MVDQALDATWGSWLLGDLCIALRRAADVLGPAESIVETRVVPPDSDDDPPMVTVVVADEQTAARLGEGIASTDFTAQWVDQPSESGWTIDVFGVRLTVRTDGGAP